MGNESATIQEKGHISEDGESEAETAKSANKFADYLEELAASKNLCSMSLTIDDVSFSLAASSVAEIIKLRAEMFATAKEVRKFLKKTKGEE